jgi:hypothetical protein
MVKLIGFCGLKRAGKDTCADYLVSKMGFNKISFADPIKDVCKILFNFNDDQLYGNSKEIIDPVWGISPRNTFQFIGTDLFRNNIDKLIPGMEKDFWIKVLQHKLDFDKKYVIADVRFPNELNFIKKNGGIIIKINNNSCVKSDHEAENVSILNADYQIDNNSTIEELYKQLDKII